MTRRKPQTKDVETSPVYRYEYSGTQPVIFPDLTAHGYPLVEPGDVVEVSAPMVHHELVPVDDATSTATDELRAWAAALEDEANGRTADAPADVDDEAIPSESPDDDTTDTEPESVGDAAAGDDSTAQGEPDEVKPDAEASA